MQKHTILDQDHGPGADSKVCACLSQQTEHQQQVSAGPFLL